MQCRAGQRGARRPRLQIQAPVRAGEREAGEAGRPARQEEEVYPLYNGSLVTYFSQHTKRLNFLPHTTQ